MLAVVPVAFMSPAVDVVEKAHLFFFSLFLNINPILSNWEHSFYNIIGIKSYKNYQFVNSVGWTGPPLNYKIWARIVLLGRLRLNPHLSSDHDRGMTFWSITQRAYRAMGYGFRTLFPSPMKFVFRVARRFQSILSCGMSTSIISRSSVSVLRWSSYRWCIVSDRSDWPAQPSNQLLSWNHA